MRFFFNLEEHFKDERKLRSIEQTYKLFQVGEERKHKNVYLRTLVFTNRMSINIKLVCYCSIDKDK